jgi:SM-20-related protein
MLLVEDFVDPAPLLAELRAAGGTDAPVYGAASGGRVAFAVRRTTRVAAPENVRDSVLQRLDAVRPRLEQHFDVTLGAIEEPQFLRYDDGDYFVAHQDGNTPLLLLDRQQGRLISIVIFLSDREDYDGGELVMHGPRMERHPVPARAGTLVAFRAETTHEVTPVTRGPRYTVATWFVRP